MKKIAFFFLFSFSFMLVSQAQLVNIEKKRKKNYKGLRGAIGLAIDFKDNGNDIFQAKNSLDLQYATGAHTFIFLNDFSMMQVNDDKLVNNGFQHFRYNYTLRDSSFLTFELFSQHQYNSIKLLEQRIIAGLGPRFRLINMDKLVFYFAPLVMYESEKLSDVLNTHTEQIKLDAYVSAHFAINDLLGISHVTYYQPNFEEWSDYRLSSETMLKLKFTKNLSLSFVYGMNYDANPPDAIQNLFYNLQNKISYSF